MQSWERCPLCVPAFPKTELSARLTGTTDRYSTVHVPPPPKADAGHVHIDGTVVNEAITPELIGGGFLSLRDSSPTRSRSE